MRHGGISGWRFPHQDVSAVGPHPDGRHFRHGVDHRAAVRVAHGVQLPATASHGAWDTAIRARLDQHMQPELLVRHRGVSSHLRREDDLLFSLLRRMLHQRNERHRAARLLRQLQLCRRVRRRRSGASSDGRILQERLPVPGLLHYAAVHRVRVLLFDQDGPNSNTTEASLIYTNV
ncbi:unnamed protein product [Ixodes pacificus]